MEAVLHESSQEQPTTEKKPKPEIKKHPTLTTITWSSIAEGLGSVFNGNLVKDPIDITFSNVKYTADLGFRKGKSFYIVL